MTIVWARRFAGYKRPELLLYDWAGFLNLINHVNYPVQVIWAGKPHPGDETGIALFNRIIDLVAPFPNCAVLAGYELQLPATLKKDADIWLNNPRMFHEASGTSGMTAAMNGAVNVSVPNGWVPEFASDGQNCLVIPPASAEQPEAEHDAAENKALLKILHDQALPMYYEHPEDWFALISAAFADIRPAFDSDRLAGQFTRIFIPDQAHGRA